MVVGELSGRRATVGAGGRLPEASEPPGGRAEGRRIRDDARDGVYVMAFSLLASTVTTLTVVLLTKLVG
jgi:hypothetical protein